MSPYPLLLSLSLIRMNKLIFCAPFKFQYQCATNMPDIRQILFIIILITNKMSNHRHQPERFDRFVELKDGSGFTIPGNKFVFKYDRYGGWFDEHGNCYDKNGQPADPPSDQEDSLSDHDRDAGYDSADEDDEFEREFGRPKSVDDNEEEDSFQTARLQKVAGNMQILITYPLSKPLRVHFYNVSYFTKKDDILNFVTSRIPGIINLVTLTNEKGFNGKGYFVVENSEAAERLIKLEGQRIGDREIKFDLDDLEEFIADPLTESELKPLSKGSKVYIKKSQTPAQQLTKPSPSIEEKKEVLKKPQAVKVEQKSIPTPKKIEEDREQFIAYIFLKKDFPKKTSFKDWLSELKIEEGDYKQLQKIEAKPDYARIVMKRKVYKILSSAKRNGQLIQFSQE